MKYSPVRTAIILVGGYGTRLRPLTLLRPKPLVQFCNKPMIQYQIEALKTHGVQKIILATNYRTEDIVKEMDRVAEELNIKILFSVEKESLNTGGPLRLASKYLSNEQSIFVLNSDIICDYPFEELQKKHNLMKRAVTILTTKVEDPSRFGVILEKDSIIQEFIEKPKKPISNLINAGIYLINTEVIRQIPERSVSLEKEIFTILAAKRQMTSCEHRGYWKDIGQFKDYLDAQSIFLRYKTGVISYREENERKSIENKPITFKKDNLDSLENTDLDKNLKIELIFEKDTNIIQKDQSNSPTIEPVKTAPSYDMANIEESQKDLIVKSSQLSNGPNQIGNVTNTPFNFETDIQSLGFYNHFKDGRETSIDFNYMPLRDNVYYSTHTNKKAHDPTITKSETGSSESLHTNSHGFDHRTSNFESEINCYDLIATHAYEAEPYPPDATFNIHSDNIAPKLTETNRRYPQLTHENSFHKFHESVYPRHYKHSYHLKRFEVSSPSDSIPLLQKTLAPIQLLKPYHNSVNCQIDPTAFVHPSANIQQNVVIGPNCTIGQGVFLKDCTIMANTEIENYSLIEKAIIGPYCYISSWCRIESYSVLADNVTVKNRSVLKNTIVLPNKTITQSATDEKII